MEDMTFLQQYMNSKISNLFNFARNFDESLIIVYIFIYLVLIFRDRLIPF